MPERPEQDREGPLLESVQHLLCDVLHWSTGNGEYGLYCKLCDGEGVDVEHDDNCPVPEIRLGYMFARLARLGWWASQTSRKNAMDLPVSMAETRYEPA